MKLVGLLKLLVESPDGKIPDKKEKGKATVAGSEPPLDHPTNQSKSSVQQNQTVVRRSASPSDGDNRSSEATAEGSGFPNSPRPVPSDLHINTRSLSVKSDIQFSRQHSQASPSLYQKSPNPFVGPNYELLAPPLNPPQDFQNNPFYQGGAYLKTPLGGNYAQGPEFYDAENEENRDQYTPFPINPFFPTRGTYEPRRQSQSSAFFPGEFGSQSGFERRGSQANSIYQYEPPGVGYYDRRQSNPYDRRQSQNYVVYPNDLSSNYSVGNPFVPSISFMRTSMPYHYANVPVNYTYQSMPFSSTYIFIIVGIHF